MIEEEYTITRLTNENMASLIPLYKDAFGQDKTLEQIKAKFDTAFLGMKNLAFMAVDKQGTVAGFYAVFPFKYSIGGKEMVLAQVGDLMTHSQHRRKGLYIHLANVTHPVAYAEGVDLIVTFPHVQVMSSYLGFVNRLDFVHTHTLHGYYIKVNAAPLAFALNKIGVTKKLYKAYSNFILGLFTDTKTPYVEEVPVSYGEVENTAGFIRYKKGYSGSRMVKMKGQLFWVKVSGNVLQVGAIQRLKGHNFADTLGALKKLAFLLGIRVVQFDTSPGTYWDAEFIKHYQPIDSFKVTILNPKGLNLDNFKFSLGDIDSF